MRVQRQGRCDTFATEFDLEAEEYVPLPKGDVHKKKEIIQDVTLHDLDIANARPQVHIHWHASDTPGLLMQTSIFLQVSYTHIIIEMVSSGRPGHLVHDGTTDEAQED